MLQVHTIFKDNIEREATKYNWTDHDLDVINEIVEVWLDSKIAESVLLFFEEKVSGDLQSYMLIVPEYKGKMPNMKKYKRTNVNAEIIPVKPYKKTLEISDGSFRYENDDDYITSTMKKYFWDGNVVFVIQADITTVFKESIKKEQLAKRLFTTGTVAKGRVVGRTAMRLRQGRTAMRLCQRKTSKMKAWKRCFFIETEDKKLEIKTIKKVAKKPVKKAIKKPVKKAIKKPVKKAIKKPVAHRAGKGI